MSELQTSGEKPLDIAKNTRVDLSYFSFLSVLGKGNFASQVLLAERKDSTRLYAIKIYRKDFIIPQDEVTGPLTERDILIKTERNLYTVLEYVSGGDLQFQIQKRRFSSEAVHLYGAELCLAIKFLHENGILHRGIQLENVLLAPDGHIKLAGFFVAKQGMSPSARTSTFTGTFEYMPPEMLLDKSYGFSIDWHGLGILMYSLLCQKAPFSGEDEDEIYDAIIESRIVYPEDLPAVAASFLKQLLVRDPEERLGSGPTDAAEVMAHEYFAGVDWDAVYQKRVPVPFVPTISHRTDTRNFDDEFTCLSPALPVGDSVLTPEMQEEFRSFSMNMLED